MLFRGEVFILPSLCIDASNEASPARVYFISICDRSSLSYQKVQPKANKGVIMKSI